MARTDLPAFTLNFKVQLGIAPRKLTDHGNTPPYRDVEVKKKKKKLSKITKKICQKTKVNTATCLLLI